MAAVEQADGKPRGRSSPLAGRPASSPLLTERAYEEIKAQILSGELRPGDMVAGNKFAQILGMSRTPVHDALALLVKEGLLRGIPRVGYVVTSLSLEDMQEIFQLRLTLETLAVELALRRPSPGPFEPFQEMEAKVQRVAQQMDPEDPRFLATALQANRDFHVMVASLSGNRRLVDTIASLIDDSQRMLPLDSRIAAQINFMSSKQHRAIHDAMKAGDRNAAREAVALHVRGAQERIAAAWMAPPIDV